MISFDSASNSSGAQSGTFTWSHTCTGVQLGLFLSLTFEDSSNGTTSAPTYNGVAMIQAATSTGNFKEVIWYLANPSTGSHTISVATNSIDTTAHAVTGEAVSLTSVGQVATVGASGTYVSGSSNIISMSVTTTAPNSYLVDSSLSSASTGNTVTATGTGQLKKNTISYLTGENVAVQSIQPTTTIGTYALSYSTHAVSANDGLVIEVLAFNPAVEPRYWVGGTGNWDATTTTHWAASSGGSGGASVPIAGENVFFDANSGGGTVTITASASCNNLDFTGYTGTWVGTNTVTIDGNLTVSTGMTASYTGVLNFDSRTTGKTITLNGKALPAPFVFNSPTGGWTFEDAPTIGSVTLTSGSLNLNNLLVTLTGAGTVWSAVPSNTLVTGTSTIKITDTSSSAKAFSGGGYAYNNLYITGVGTGTYTIAGNNTFNDFKIDTPPHTVNFTAFSIQALNTFTVSGTAGNLITLQSTVSGSPWVLSKITPGIVSCDYLSLKDSHVS